MPVSPELEFHPPVLVTHRDSKSRMKLHLPAAALRAGSSAMQVGSCDNGCSGARARQEGRELSVPWGVSHISVLHSPSP